MYFWTYGSESDLTGVHGEYEHSLSGLSERENRLQLKELIREYSKSTYMSSTPKLLRFVYGRWRIVTPVIKPYVNIPEVEGWEQI